MKADFSPLYTKLKQRIKENPDLNGFNLEDIARLSVRLLTNPPGIEQIPLGASRIGGSPDVPTDFEWPRWLPSKERNDRYGNRWQPHHPSPLAFIAQLNLSQIPRIDDSLPESGWLYFFYDRYCETWGFDPADRGCCRVVYLNCDQSKLSMADRPSDLDDEFASELCVVETQVELILPDDFSEIQYDSPVFETYRNLVDEFCDHDAPTIHRLLGHPQIVQNPMELECQLVSNGIDCGGGYTENSERIEELSRGANDWQLLLQIDSDDSPGWMWGDCGRIYFWIKKQDLAALRFDNVWLILQCC